MSNLIIRLTEKSASNLRNEIGNLFGGERLLDCYSCGACVGNCPISKISNDFRPLKIIQKAALGLEEQLIESKTIWKCAYCFTCQDVCPQDVQFPILLYAIRSYVIRKNILPELVANFINNILKTGRSIPINDVIQEEREYAGLHAIKTSSKVVEEINKIMKKSGLLNALKNLKL